MYKRQLDIRPKHVVLALLTLVAIACGIIALIEFELRNMRLDFDLSGLATVVSVGTLRPPPCSSAVNRPLAGDPTQEATMAYVAGVVDLYRTTFSKMPESITDLDKLPTFENADKLNADEMKRTCFIEQMLPNRGYVLACGGKLPPMERLDFALARIVDERFVIVDGIEVLFIPFSGGCIYRQDSDGVTSRSKPQWPGGIVSVTACSQQLMLQRHLILRSVCWQCF